MNEQLTAAAAREHVRDMRRSAERHHLLAQTRHRVPRRERATADTTQR
jgi:hypothetical protein